MAGACFLILAVSLSCSAAICANDECDTNEFLQVKFGVDHGADWNFQSSKYGNSMTLTTLVKLGGVQQTSGTLAAFVGSDIRGLQATPTVPPFGTYAGQQQWQMTCYADSEGETLSFKFKSDDGTITELTETLEFVINDNKGSLISPITFNGGSAPPTPTSAPTTTTTLPPTTLPPTTTTTPTPTPAPTTTPTPTPAPTTTASSNDWTFDYTPYENSMSMTTLVEIAGVRQTSGTLAAWVGTDIRGVQGSPTTPPFGPYASVPMWQIMIYADDPGETLTFKFKSSDGTITALTGTGNSGGSWTFDADNHGSVLQPEELTDGTTTTPPPCEDDAAAGAAYAESQGWGQGRTCAEAKAGGLCSNTAHPLIDQYCVKTCGLCTSAPTPAPTTTTIAAPLPTAAPNSCEDDPAGIATYAEGQGWGPGRTCEEGLNFGMCANPFHTDIKYVYCRKTCGDCPTA